MICGRLISVEGYLAGSSCQSSNQINADLIEIINFR